MANVHSNEARQSTCISYSHANKFLFQRRITVPMLLMGKLQIKEGR